MYRELEVLQVSVSTHEVFSITGVLGKVDSVAHHSEMLKFKVGFSGVSRHVCGKAD